jgi:transcriptional regulator
MYIPNHNLETDRNKILDFIKRFNFGTIVTSKDNIPIATHLPFLIEEREDKIFLVSHFAKANKQWQDMNNNKNVLVIFSEPHAYISPKFYEKLQNVPTWNYISVHCYGKGKILDNFDDALNVLEKSIDFFDDSYKAQWEALDEKYRNGLIGGITAFEIEVTDIQAKKKLSQNKTETERKNIIEAFEKSSDYNENLIGEYMRSEQK